jgi:hypothetical protein
MAVTKFADFGKKFVILAQPSFVAARRCSFGEGGLTKKERS